MYVGIDGRVILKYILKGIRIGRKGVQTEFVWLRTGASGMLL
jgi:hypothetical protein